MLEFDTLNRTNVPENTIQTTWNAFSKAGRNLSKEYDINKIGELYQDEHTRKKCVTETKGLIKKFRQRRGSRRRSRGKLNNTKQVCSTVGDFYKGEVPLGSWAEVYDNLCYSGNPLYTIKYNPKDKADERLSDQIATDCSGKNTTNPNCILTNSPDSNSGKENCFVSGIQYPVFCQLGDYVASTQKCVDQCSPFKGTDSQNYCTYALDRLCSKKMGDPLKRDANGEIVFSGKNWIRQDICTNYCGGPETISSPQCQENKASYCKRPTSFPGAEDYCRTLWENVPNFDNMNEACASKLTDINNEENITSGKGCAKLCPGLGQDVNSQWCNEKRSEYCSKGDNIFTKYCYDFCKENGDQCGILFEKCKSKIDELGNFINSDSDLTFANFCSCFMDQPFYNNYKNTIEKNILERGFAITQPTIVDPNNSQPECIYPTCNSKAIMTSFQKQNKNNCDTNCLNTIYKDYSILQDTDLLKCASIFQPEDPKVILPFSSEPPLTTLPPMTSIPPPVTSEQPPITSEVPPVTSEVPPMTSEQPPITSEQPPITSEVPPVTSEQPPVTSEQPPVTSEVPPVTSEVPPVTSEEEGSFFEQPIDNKPFDSDDTQTFDVIQNQTENESTEEGGGEAAVDGKEIGIYIGIVIGILIVLSLLVYAFAEFIKYKRNQE